MCVCLCGRLFFSVTLVEWPSGQDFCEWLMAGSKYQRSASSNSKWSYFVIWSFETRTQNRTDTFFTFIPISLYVFGALGYEFSRAHCRSPCGTFLGKFEVLLGSANNVRNNTQIFREIIYYFLHKFFGIFCLNISIGVLTTGRKYTHIETG